MAHYFCWPEIKTREEIIKERRMILEYDYAIINRKQALKMFEQNPEIEFEWIGLEEIHEALGFKDSYLPAEVQFHGYLVERGQKSKKLIHLIKSYEKKLKGT